MLIEAVNLSSMKSWPNQMSTWNVNFYYYCLDQLIQENFPCVNTVYQLYVWGCFQLQFAKLLAKKKKKKWERVTRGWVVSWGFEEQILGVAGFVGSWQSEFHSSLSLPYLPLLSSLLEKFFAGERYWQPNSTTFLRLLLLQKLRVFSLTTLYQRCWLACLGSYATLWEIAVDGM